MSAELLAVVIADVFSLAGLVASLKRTWSVAAALWLVALAVDIAASSWSAGIAGLAFGTTAMMAASAKR